ncbi:MAG: CBS domain-containing protein [Deltaproteobacteria bacterium]|nr:CBS domain-containing protein [Deltaproteobacteria bacterium]MBI3078058.1 CBS domain-containing protein [Deltaproteobacteria bacterium]
MKSIGTLCASRVVTAHPEDSVAQVARLMKREHVGTVVITGRNGKPMGIVSDRDLATRVVAFGLDPRDTTAGAVMTRNPASIRADADIVDAAQAMAARGVRRLPIVADGKMVGIVSLDDLLLLLSAEMGNLAAAICAEQEHEGGKMRVKARLARA